MSHEQHLEPKFEAPFLTFKEKTGMVTGRAMSEGSEKPPGKETRQAERKEGTREGEGYGHLTKDLNVPGETLEISERGDSGFTS